MSESDLIGRTPHPATVDTLVEDLGRLGVEPGDVLVVHSSLSSIGWVAGGAAGVVDALLRAVGAEGTISMPAHSGDWSDPAGWMNPPVPASWWSAIVGGRPAFDPYATPLREMGAVADNLLLRRQTLRSSHPLHSHMANGRAAAAITGTHPLEDSFGDGSPLGRLYELDAKVVLLGVSHEHNTSLHLAESRAEWAGKGSEPFRSTVVVDGRPQVVSWEAFAPDADDFGALGAVIDASGLVAFGKVGQADARLSSMRAIVDMAVAWFEATRGPSET